VPNDEALGDGKETAVLRTADRDRALGVVVRIDSGTVWVNKHLDMGPDTPCGGAKQSGIGVEMGREGLSEFTQATIINMAK
jgi:acyl-CoA reductase-like NAD-dependent aldehyde dehydrogenase